VNREFLFRFFFVPGSLKRRGKCVVDLRISRREALRSAQRRNGLFIFLLIHETKPIAQISLSKIRIKLNRLSELGNRLSAFLISARKLSQNIVRTSIGGIDRDFLEELLPGSFRGFRPGIGP